MDRPSLDVLGLAHGTDKASNAHDYLHVYDDYLSPLRESLDPVRLLEIGWWEGQSMRMWRDYFDGPDDVVVGLDIEPKDPIPGVRFVQGDQRDGRLLAEISSPDGWDVIVDDGSHVSSMTKQTFTHLWGWLKPGGLYIVEDLQVSYHRDWGGDPNPRATFTIMAFLKGLTDGVHHGHADVRQHPAPLSRADHIGFWPGLCIIRKAADS